MRYLAHVLACAALLAALPRIASAQDLEWTLLGGMASDIGVGPKGDGWVVGSVHEAGGYGIFKFDGANWIKAAGGAARISVGPSGPWIVNDAGLIWRMSNGSWQQMPGTGKDIGVGANGTVWVVGTNAVAGGFGLYRWNETRKAWDAMPGGGTSLAVDPEGNAWVVNANGALSRWNGSAFEIVRPSETVDVGIGANGAVFIVGKRAIFEWSGGTWKQRGASPAYNTGGARIAVDNLGNPWFVAPEHYIWTASKAARGTSFAPFHAKNTTTGYVAFLPSQVDGFGATFGPICVPPNTEVVRQLPVVPRFTVQVASVASCDLSDCCASWSSGAVANYQSTLPGMRVEARSGLYSFAP